MFNSALHQQFVFDSVEDNEKRRGMTGRSGYVLQTGRVRYQDTPKRLFENPEVAESFLSI